MVWGAFLGAGQELAPTEYMSHAAVSAAIRARDIKCLLVIGLGCCGHEYSPA